VAETDLQQAHLAELHEQAAALGIPRYRMLPRSELIAAIEDARAEEPTEAEPTGHEPAEEEPAEERPEEPPTEEPPGAEPPAEEPPAEEPPEAADESAEGGPSEPAPGERAEEGEIVVEGAVVAEGEEPVEVDAAGPRESEEPTEAVTGVLDLMPQRFGFLRVHGLHPHAEDVYISASQVRRCELRPGDEVAGPVRQARRGERHRALVHVDRVNGEEPLAAERPDFDALPPVLPERRIPLDGDRNDVLNRAIDLFAPLTLGQRVLVRSAPRSGRTTLLRGVVRALDAAQDIRLVILLVDERPEETTAWHEAVADSDAELAVAPADLAPRDQVEVAELALERSRRLAEDGGDVVLLVDSLSRLVHAAGDIAAAKRLFGSGRNLAGGGSLTVIATVLADGSDRGEAERAVATTESSTIALDPELAAAGVVPALRIAECRVSNEEELREPEELEAVRRLRTELAGLSPAEAAAELRARIEASQSNRELLGLKQG
jgi:transcription termination factor Rho